MGIHNYFRFSLNCEFFKSPSYNLKVFIYKSILIYYLLVVSKFFPVKSVNDRSRTYKVGKVLPEGLQVPLAGQHSSSLTQYNKSAILPAGL